ncbi:MAG: hypothetical protein V4808_05040 [Pseudomonadota bacterium]
MSLMIGLFAAAATVTPTCTPVARPSLTRSEVVATFMAAMASKDFARLGTLIKPGARAVFEGGWIPIEKLVETLNPEITITVVETKPNSDNTITVRYHGLDKENVIAIAFSQEGGCVTAMKQVS